MQNRYYNLCTASVKHFMSRPELQFIYPSQLEVRRRAGTREGHRTSSTSSGWMQTNIHFMRKST